jgi:hypothetical protein
LDKATRHFHGQLCYFLKNVRIFLPRWRGVRGSAAVGR